ncbi:MAG TPA: 3,4-dehydroadipyl-CoA semialdehyde dehydrogenase [Gammaproteobacteria bacterium]
MTKKLRSFVSGGWHEGSGGASILVNPATEQPLAETSSSGIDFAAALDHARSVGGPALRAMTFARRADLLQGLYDALYANREEFIEIAIVNGGNTRNDAKFDVDGATFTLLAYVDLGRQLGDRNYLCDGETIQLGRTPRYGGRHLLTPLQGAAVHINAYNFPAWGMMEKAAVALLAGLPVVSKPATSTALLAHRMTETIVESGALPEGAFSFIAGSAGDLLDHLGPQDVLAFTGSGVTAANLRRLDAHADRSVRVNVEADSLNAAVMGPDVESGSETWQLMLNEVFTDIRQKAGQKCTAIRRVFVPPSQLDTFVEALRERLEDVVVGNPAEPSVRMGPLVNRGQLEDVRQGLAALAAEVTKVAGDTQPAGLEGVDDGVGYFVTPHLFCADDLAAGSSVHAREIFGPAATVMPYDDTASLVAACASGGGSLVSSVYSDDRAFSRELLLALAPYNGRLTHGSSKVGGISPGPGTVLPTLVHGGPGRAGGGEELGGLRGLSFYLQRTAVQGYSALLEKFFPD